MRGPLILLVSLSACASAGAGMEVGSESAGSAYFSLSRPYVSHAGKAAAISGRVCRLSRGTLLSPPGVRVEHVAATGDTIEVAHAYVPAIHGRSDEACSFWQARVSWSFAPGERVRACFDRGRSCRGKPETKAAAPAG